MKQKLYLLAYQEDGDTCNPRGVFTLNGLKKSGYIPFNGTWDDIVSGLIVGQWNYEQYVVETDGWTVPIPKEDANLIQSAVRTKEEEDMIEKKYSDSIATMQFMEVQVFD